eukprot:TRINITY_DN7733_c0_g1_i1.p1 TRINITY_DN7733_c0_g1~~TRINITY_DN7733_c0_g1_i1.p1  ORF type:complete len:763 (+),score=140.45 TRINITY_DN7733_c0_g1_i1:146-2290(+)
MQLRRHFRHRSSSPRPQTTAKSAPPKVDGLKGRMFIDTVKNTGPLPPINLYKNDFKPSRPVTECLGKHMGLNDLDLMTSWCKDRAKSILSSHKGLPGVQFEDVYSILLYTYDSGLDRENNVYYQLNKVLRERASHQLVEWRDYLFYLLTALNKLPAQGPRNVYRGMNYKVDTREKYREGERVSWNGFTSTSVSKSQARNFLGKDQKGGTIFIIKIQKTGRAVHDFSAIPTEEEIILEPNSVFEVTNSEDLSEVTNQNSSSEDSGIIVVFLRQLPTQYPILLGSNTPFPSPSPSPIAMSIPYPSPSPKPKPSPKPYSIDSKPSPSPNTIAMSSPYPSPMADVNVDFDDMNLKNELLRGISAYGFKRPSLIQQRAIVPLARGHNVIAESQSGTCKTTAFVIGVLQRIDVHSRQCQALILCPTLEAANSTKNVFGQIGKYLNIRCHACVGANYVAEDRREIQNGVHIVVGTPIRVLDLINRRILDLSKIKVTILDEVDELLSKNWKADIHQIFTSVPKHAQVGMFSATMPSGALEIAHEFVSNPVRILMKDELNLEGIEQFYINANSEEDRFEILCKFYQNNRVTRSIIFCNSPKKVEELAYKMKQRNFTVSTISEKMQNDRDSVLAEFRLGSASVLITTDLLARGFYVHQLSALINYEMPKNLEKYGDRIDRCGRFGCQGPAINFIITNEDRRIIKELEQNFYTQMKEMQIDPYRN